MEGKMLKKINNGLGGTKLGKCWLVLYGLICEACQYFVNRLQKTEKHILTGNDIPFSREMENIIEQFKEVCVKGYIHFNLHFLLKRLLSQWA